MDTLLLRLAGPLQSWGVQSHFTQRDSGREPSKSGVIGLLCAALGRPRTDPIADLVSLQLGVRVEREGTLATDYHTAQNVLKAGGGIKDTEVSLRQYLADADFLVGLSGDSALLRSLFAALQNPRWSLALGRKAFVPSESVWLADGLQIGCDLLSCLKNYPWLATRGGRPDYLRLIYDAPDGEIIRPDVPLSFALRQFGNRRVRTELIPLPDSGAAA